MITVLFLGFVALTAAVISCLQWSDPIPGRARGDSLASVYGSKPMDKKQPQNALIDLEHTLSRRPGVTAGLGSAEQGRQGGLSFPCRPMSGQSAFVAIGPSLVRK